MAGFNRVFEADEHIINLTAQTRLQPVPTGVDLSLKLIFFSPLLAQLHR